MSSSAGSGGAPPRPPGPPGPASAARMAGSAAVAGRPARLSRAARSGGVEAGPAHQVNGRAVAATAASVRAILVSAVAAVNRAPATTLNVSSASPLSATTRSSAGHTVMPGTWRCRWQACSAKFSSIRASRPSSSTARRLTEQV